MSYLLLYFIFNFLNLKWLVLISVSVSGVCTLSYRHELFFSLIFDLVDPFWFLALGLYSNRTSMVDKDVAFLGFFLFINCCFNMAWIITCLVFLSSLFRRNQHALN